MHCHLQGMVQISENITFVTVYYVLLCSLLFLLSCLVLRLRCVLLCCDAFVCRFVRFSYVMVLKPIGCELIVAGHTRLIS